MYPKVSIIILNWNRWKDTVECLESLYQNIYPDYNVVVIDNGSSDKSIKKIKDYCEGNIRVGSDFFQYNEGNKPIKVLEYSEEELNHHSPKLSHETVNLSGDELILIKNNENHGFAEGNNIGMRFVLRYMNPDYILLLNNDTVVDRKFLSELLNMAESDAEIGAVGPKVYYYDYKGRRDVINYAGENINFYTSRGKRFGRFERDKGQYDEIMENDKIDGSCMLIKKEVIEKVGMFDPIYFAYWEEADLCVRIKNAGYKLVYVPKARIWHKIGVSWDTYFSYFIIYHFLVRNRLIFIWRYASTFQKIVFSGFFIIYLLFNIVLMLIKEDINTSKEGLKAIKDGIRDFIIMIK
ncbi:MAG: glycosyltransferase family 2 protein [Methanobacteriaceae archaeon]|nr:glycosyltransferase family 2 protein [Methanobacteriaceae archaeon]